LVSREDEPSTITVQGQQVAVVEELLYLGSLIHPTQHFKALLISHVAMPSLLWLCRTETIRSRSQESSSPLS